MVFHHARRLCAVPTAHVRAVHDVAPSAAPAVGLQLWPEGDGADTADRWAELAVGELRTFICCGEPHIIELSEATTWPLSALLSSVIGLPHVVGLSQTAYGAAWLVDLRYASRGEAGSRTDPLR